MLASQQYQQLLGRGVNCVAALIIAAGIVVVDAAASLATVAADEKSTKQQRRRRTRRPHTPADNHSNYDRCAGAWRLIGSADSPPQTLRLNQSLSLQHRRTSCRNLQIARRHRPHASANSSIKDAFRQEDAARSRQNDNTLISISVQSHCARRRVQKQELIRR